MCVGKQTAPPYAWAACALQTGSARTGSPSSLRNERRWCWVASGSVTRWGSARGRCHTGSQTPHGTVKYPRPCPRPQLTTAGNGSDRAPPPRIRVGKQNHSSECTAERGQRKSTRDTAVPLAHPAPPPGGWGGGAQTPAQGADPQAPSPAGSGAKRSPQPARCSCHQSCSGRELQIPTQRRCCLTAP